METLFNTDRSYVRVQDDSTKIITFGLMHLNKGPYWKLHDGLISVYDIVLNDVDSSYRTTALRKARSDGYSIVFKHKGKGKILIYNS